jgi:hypothetical protein
MKHSAAQKNEITITTKSVTPSSSMPGIDDKTKPHNRHINPQINNTIPYEII